MSKFIKIFVFCSLMVILVFLGAQGVTKARKNNAPGILKAAITAISALMGSGGASNTTPIISEVSLHEITDTSVNISWITNEPANSQIEYGTNEDYGFTTSLGTARILSHEQSLINLLPNTQYHVRVRSMNIVGNLAVSSDYVFTTISSSPQEPPPGESGGGGGGIISPSSFNISFLGKAYPGAHIKIGARDMERKLEIPVKEIIVDSSDGSFTVRFNSLQGFSSYSFVVNDKEGRLAQSKIFNINLPEHTTQEKYLYIFISNPNSL